MSDGETARLETDLKDRVETVLSFLGTVQTDDLDGSQARTVIIEKIDLVAASVRAIVIQEIADELNELARTGAFVDSEALRHRAKRVMDGDPLLRVAYGYRRGPED